MFSQPRCIVLIIWMSPELAVVLIWIICGPYLRVGALMS
jgi:hypothetical protein